MDQFLKNDHELRKEVLMLAGYIAEGESMRAEDAAIDFSKLIARIAVQKDQTVVSIAMIMMTLAKYIEKNL